MRLPSPHRAGATGRVRTTRTAAERPDYTGGTPCLRQGRCTCLVRWTREPCQIAWRVSAGIDDVVDLRRGRRRCRGRCSCGTRRPWRSAPASRSLPSGMASSCLRIVMLTMPSGPMTAISAVGQIGEVVGLVGECRSSRSSRRRSSCAARSRSSARSPRTRRTASWRRGG